MKESRGGIHSTSKILLLCGHYILCCVNWWSPIYIRLRFCSGAEARHYEVEGELMGFLCVLEKTRFWTLGSPDLMLLTDHMPLVGMVSRNVPNWEFQIF